MSENNSNSRVLDFAGLKTYHQGILEKFASKSAVEETLASHADLLKDFRSQLQNTLLPTIKEGSLVQEDCLEGFNLNVVSHFETKQEGSGNPYPAGGGKNIIPFPYASGTITHNGVTFTNNGDGSITIDGTPINEPASDYPLVAGGLIDLGDEYWFGLVNGTVKGDYIFTLRDADGNSVNGVNMRYQGNTTKAIQMRALYGNTFNNVMVFPMIEKATVASDWEPYSNIRPIVGYDNISITRSGKNLLKLEYKSGVPSINTGYDVNASGWASDYINIGNNIVTLSRNDTTATTEMYLFLYDENKNYIGYIGNVKAGASLCSNKITGYENAKYCRARMSDGSESNIRLQLELGETATDYEPYKGEIFTISLGDTYYGGSIDWNTGELIVDKAGYIATGADNELWEKIDASSAEGLSYYFTNIAPANTINVEKTAQQCSHYQHGYIVSNNNPQNRFRIYTPTNGAYERFCVRPDITAYPNLTSWKAYLKDQYSAGTPVQVVYELLEPQIIKLEPKIIKSIQGQNVLYNAHQNRVIFNTPLEIPQKVIDHVEKKGTDSSLGFYKFASNEEGHIFEVSNVTKDDILSLGAANEEDFATHINNKSNPHEVTLSQLGIEKTGEEISNSLLPIIKEGILVHSDCVKGTRINVITEFEPKQESNGNPYPPGGGKNLLPGVMMGAAWMSKDGTLNKNQPHYTSTEKFPVVAGKTYIDSTDNNTAANRKSFHYWDANGVWLGCMLGNQDYTINNRPDGAVMAAITYYNPDTTQIAKWAQVEEGTTATAYEPYSNIRPIIGYDTISIIRSGKNLLNFPNREAVEIAGVIVSCSNGAVSFKGTSTAVVYTNGKGIIDTPTLPNGTYKTTGGTSNVEVFAKVIENGTAKYYYKGETFTISDTNILEMISCRVLSGKTVDETIYPMLVVANETDLTYEPYKSETFTMSLGNTYYGGSIDWSTGELVVDKAHVKLTADSITEKTTWGEIIYVLSSSAIIHQPAVSYTAGGLCDTYATATNYAHLRDNNNVFAFGSDGRIMIHDERAENVNDYITLLEEMGGIDIVYPLAEPKVIVLKPQIIKALEGKNYVYGSNKNQAIFNVPLEMPSKVIEHVQNKGVAATSGLYKFSSNEEGHISSVVPVDLRDLQFIGAADAETLAMHLMNKENPHNVTTVALSNATESIQQFESIPNNADLNDYKTAGFYTATQIDKANSLTNNPVKTKSTGIYLKVYQLTSNVVAQMLICTTIGEIYTRRYNSSNPTDSQWNEWALVGGSIFSAGDGLTLSDRTFKVGAGTGISVTDDAVGLATISTITPGQYGPSTDVIGDNDETMSVPLITVDAYGRVTNITNQTYTAKNTTYTIPTALKNPNSLTVYGNTTKCFDYDGSAVKTLTIKPGSNITVTSDTSGNITIGNTYSYSLPTASSSLGGVKTTSTVTSNSGLTACPIIDGVVYYKDTNTHAVSSVNNKTGAVTLTYSDVGAAAASHGTHVTAATVKTALGVGTGTSNFLREDGTWQPVSPGTTSTANNATITIKAGTGLKTGGSFTTNQDSEATITLDHNNSITAGTASGSATKTLTFGGTFTIPTISYDAQGHITGKGTTTLTMPANPNTNTTYTLSGKASGNTWITTLTPSSGSATTSTVPAMGAASSSTAGSAGLVPAPAKGKQSKFLRGDGTWATPSTVNVTLGTTTKAYLLGTSTTPTSTATGVTTIADTGVYLDTTAGSLTASRFVIHGAQANYQVPKIVISNTQPTPEEGVLWLELSE